MILYPIVLMLVAMWLFGHGSVAVVMPVAGMMGYDIVVIADLDIGRSMGQLHFLAYVGVRNAVVVDVLL